MADRDTIFALSSGGLPAAVAIVRISGPDACSVARSLAGALPPPRYAGLRTLRHDRTELDSALVLEFPGPDSATGEDLIELHLHGGRATVAAVSAALASFANVRPAVAGEFTRRAFENGRIDLTGVEGLGDLLAAETEAQRRAAFAMTSGGLTSRVEAWREALLTASGRIEAAIDFSDEEDVVPWPERGQTLAALATDMQSVLDTPPSERLRDGIRIAIVGPPNAGKSTLLNALVDREAAITSPMAGTTRDIVEAAVQIDGLPLVFLDTAGIHADPNDPVEAIGIARARAAHASADIVLALGPVAKHDERTLSISARADIDPPRFAADFVVSAQTGLGMGPLRAAIVARAIELLPRPDAAAVNLRQRACIGDAAEDVASAAHSIDLLIVAEYLRHARLALDRLIGRTGVEDVLDALFGRFCIGK